MIVNHYVYGSKSTNAQVRAFKDKYGWDNVWSKQTLLAPGKYCVDWYLTKQGLKVHSKGV